MPTASGTPLEGAAVSTQPVPFAAHERVILSQQARFDRRHLPLLWYWRLLRDDLPPGKDRLDGGGATSPDEDLFESPRAHRRYAPPMAVHLFVDDVSEKKKAMRKGVVETTNLARIALSRAEARRLGASLETYDVRDGLVRDDVRGDPIFVPRPEDVFLVRGEHYFEVQQLVEERLGLSSIVTVWRGTAVMFRDDIAAPLRNRLPSPPTRMPRAEVHAQWPA